MDKSPATNQTSRLALSSVHRLLACLELLNQKHACPVINMNNISAGRPDRPDVALTSKCDIVFTFHFFSSVIQYSSPVRQYVHETTTPRAVSDFHLHASHRVQTPDSNSYVHYTYRLMLAWNCLEQNVAYATCELRQTTVLNSAVYLYLQYHNMATCGSWILINLVPVVRFLIRFEALLKSDLL